MPRLEHMKCANASLSWLHKIRPLFRSSTVLPSRRVFKILPFFRSYDFLVGPVLTSEVGIYKRKQESKKTIKSPFDLENEEKKEKEENTVSTKKNKKRITKSVFSFLFSYFLVFFYKFPPLYVLTKNFEVHKL